MTELHLLSATDRRPFFESAAYDLQIPFEIIEKDYWVVWTLERLFSLPDLKSHLTFKGGTSLSKVYGLIERFSEDIDVSIERDFLGFDENKSPEKLSTRSQQRSLLEDLSKASSKYIQNEMLPNLSASVAAKLKTSDGWRIINDADDSSGQTLLFEYPSITPKGGYIRPFVKIEMGARAEHWPVSDHPVQSYAKEALKEKIHEPPTTVRILNAERTFWEKATILHQYAHLPADKALPSRLSRHLYDFFRLLESNIKEKALEEVDLLERVANHKKVYFASGWANYDTARKGTLKLSPHARVLEELEKDYKEMEAMFFRAIPEWKHILETIEKFEREFNAP